MSRSGDIIDLPNTLTYAVLSQALSNNFHEDNWPSLWESVGENNVRTFTWSTLTFLGRCRPRLEFVTSKEEDTNNVKPQDENPGDSGDITVNAKDKGGNRKFLGGLRQQKEVSDFYLIISGNVNTSWVMPLLFL